MFLQSCAFIRSRIESLEDELLAEFNSFHEKHDQFSLKILNHMGFLSKEIG